MSGDLSPDDKMIATSVRILARRARIHFRKAAVRAKAADRKSEQGKAHDAVELTNAYDLHVAIGRDLRDLATRWLKIRQLPPPEL